ncbi:hypothetical protein IKF25_02510 [Candidatus Saccharibacteria bacterium]|nr:hypothetical protein [Candidatus Saccharibacteria bacterium]
MDQNNMGGFAPMPGAAANNTMPSMGAPMMPGTAPQQPMPGVQPAAQPAAATAGKKDTTLMETIILVVVCVIAAAAIVFAVIFFMQFNELKSNYDSEVAMKEANARDAQAQEDIAKFEEDSKQPFEKLTGPSDYGSISFEYPKNWSVYIESDGSNNSDYKVYFSPTHVSSITNKESRYALRFTILNQQINNVQRQYDALVDKGLVTSSVFNADNNNITGTKYIGSISNDMQGIVVIFKVNDKTVILQTDVQSVYENDFNTLLTKLRRNS